MTIDTIETRSLSHADFQSMFGGIEPVVVVGAGVSSWEPTKLPTGQEFSEGVREALFMTSGHPSVSPADVNFLEVLLRDVPFEMTMERCPDQQGIGELLAQLYSANQPNPVHQALASLARKREIHSIITTNYDLALDTALLGGPLSRVVRASDVPTSPVPLYFKVHGSADEPSTMIYSLTHESELPQWKRNVIKDCINGRPLLIIGYSGFDFELCPEIARLRPTVVIWNFYSENDRDRSPGLQHILRLKVRKVGLIGDMCALLGLFGKPIIAHRALGGHYKVAIWLRSAFTSDQLLLWRARVLNTMGHARLALHAIQALSISISPHPEAILEHAQTLFHLGQYRSSALEFLRAASLSLDLRFQLLRKLDPSDALRCYGALRHAERLINSVTAELKTSNEMYIDVRMNAILKKVLVLRDRYERARKFLLGWKVRDLQAKAQQLIEEGAPLALRIGSWLAFQQFRLWAERLALPTEILTRRGGYEPLPSREGYRHLGYHVAMLMELCDRASKKLSLVNYNELVDGLSVAEHLGSHPSAWKISKLAMLRFPTEASKSRDIFRHHFKICQYTWLRRLAYLLKWP